MIHADTLMFVSTATTIIMILLLIPFLVIQAINYNRILCLYKKATEDSKIDSLTKLYNRRQIEKKLDEEKARVIRYDHSLQILFIDINDFKKINDIYGHSKGDEALRKIAKIMMDNTRKIDIVGRYGGDEFVVILPETSCEAAKRVAEKIKKAISGIYIENTAISVSIGIHEFNQKNYKLDPIEAADKKMYSDKKNK